MNEELIVWGKDIQVGDALIEHVHNNTCIEIVESIDVPSLPWTREVVCTAIVRRVTVYCDGSIGYTRTPRYFGVRAPLMVKRVASR